MKKYSNKTHLNTMPNFDTEINGFVSKLDIFDAKQKKELKEILKFHFKSISKYGVDMWQLKQRLDESMQRVHVGFQKELENALGCYYSEINEIQIAKVNLSKHKYFSTIVHELTHCLSSTRETFKNKSNFESSAMSTGFLSYLIQNIDDQKNYFAYLTNNSVYTEAITEYLSLSTISEYYGSVVPTAYIQEQKILNQLRMIVGTKVIKAYFENDYKVFDSLFENACDQKLSKIEKDAQVRSNACKYLEGIDLIFNTKYSTLSKGNALYQNDFFNINKQHLNMFQIKVVTDLLDNMDLFHNGMDVKKAILNSFTMYASNVFFGYTIPNARYFYDFWNVYFDTVVNTIESVKDVFAQCVGLNIPSTNDPEMLEYVFYAQCLSFKNYGNIVPLTREINVVEMQDISLQKYLPKDLYVKNKYMKQLKDVIFSDLTKEYFDEQQYYGFTCYDDANQALLELDYLNQLAAEEDFYDENIQSKTKLNIKSNKNFES